MTGTSLETSGARNLGIAAYQAAISATLYPIRIETSRSAATFSARLDARAVGDCQIVDAFASDPFSCTRKPALRRDANDFFLIQFQRHGTTAYSHCGRASFCPPQSLVIMDCRQDINGEQHDSARCTIVRVPAARLRSAIPDVDDFCSIAFPTTDAAGQMLVSLVRQAWRWAPQLSHLDHAALPSTLLDLLRTVVHGHTRDHATQPRHRSGQFMRLSALVKTLAHDPDLDVDALAAAMHVSRSTLYEISRAANTSVERMILEARLDATHRSLADVRYSHLSIAELAYRQGFSDPAHFSRRFKERFGMPPSAFREAGSRR